MNNKETLNGITYFQIFNYFDFSVLEKTAFCIVFKKEDLQFVLFLNKEADNKISLMDYQTRVILNREELLFALSFRCSTTDILNLIKNEVIESGTALTDPISLDDLTNYLYGFFPLSSRNKNLEAYTTSDFLFGGMFGNICQDTDQNLIVPLFHKGDFVNYYITSEKSNDLKFRDCSGFYNTKYQKENTGLVLSFNLNNSINFFQDYLTLKYHVIVPNNRVTIMNVNSIYTYLDTIKFKPDKIFFLYREDSLQEQLNSLSFFTTICSLFSSYTFIVEEHSGAQISLTVIPPKDYKMLGFVQFFANLNKDVQILLDIDLLDETINPLLKKHFFDFVSINNETADWHIISFFPKSELIGILLKNLNLFVFGSSSRYEFIEIKKKPLVDYVVSVPPTTYCH